MFFILLASAMLKCPPTKMNIIKPLSPEDKRALQEHSDRCLETKKWPCLYTFEKKGPNWYSSTCGPLVEDK
jgi:hypothetical protein